MSNSFLLLNQNASISSVKFGVENQPLLKVDSYQKDPQKLIDFAVGKSEFTPSGNFYPGIRMPLPISYLQALIHNLGPEIEAAFGVNVKQIKSGVAVFSIVTKPADELDFLQTIPHYDGLGKNKLAMIHYLCDKTEAGTSFYRHKDLGYDYIDDIRYDEYKGYIKEQFEDNVTTEYMCKDTPEFEKIATYECVFNRLLIYKISSLHSAHLTKNYDFDPSPRTGRLTITSFMEFY